MKYAITSVCLFILFTFSAPQARADSVVLTTGSVQVARSLSSIGTGVIHVGASGGSPFSLHYSGVTGGTGITPSSATFGIFESGNQVCYLGVCTSQLSGNITFNETALMGSVIGFTGNAQEGITVLFTVQFTAIGVGTFNVVQPSGLSEGLFLVSAPVPEPGALLLLMSGLAGFAAAVGKVR